MEGLFWHMVDLADRGVRYWARKRNRFNADEQIVVPTQRT